jgi:hypothetical protein
MSENDLKRVAGDSQGAVDAAAGAPPQKTGDARGPEPRPGQGVPALLGRLQGRLLLAALSGLLAWAIMDWELTGALLLDGGIFGALVLVPFIAVPRHRIMRALALVAGGAVIHQIVVGLAANGYDNHLRDQPAIILSGLLGALLAAALTVLVAPLRPGWKTGWKLWVCVAASGIVGSLPLSLLWGRVDGSSLSFAATYVLWQVLVCASLRLGSQPPSPDCRS